MEPWASRIIARVQESVVTLRGTVPSTHDKEDIEAHISRLPGVRRVENMLEVSMR
jgi:osmotically-inducible protein OsmY